MPCSPTSPWPLVGGVVLLLVDWLAGQGTAAPEAGQRLAPVVYVALVIVSGSLLTYLWVELPTGRPGERRRSGWAAVLGFFASIPIVYLALVRHLPGAAPARRLGITVGVRPARRIAGASIGGRGLPTGAASRRGSSSTVRAVGLYPTGSWFESRLPYQPATVGGQAAPRGHAKAARPPGWRARPPWSVGRPDPSTGRTVPGSAVHGCYWQSGEVPASTGANW